MTALELNAELFRQLSIIAEDETLMRKAVEAIRRLAQQKEAQTEETEYISKEERESITDNEIKWLIRLRPELKTNGLYNIPTTRRKRLPIDPRPTRNLRHRYNKDPGRDRTTYSGRTRSSDVS